MLNPCASESSKITLDTNCVKFSVLLDCVLCMVLMYGCSQIGTLLLLGYKSSSHGL